MNKFFNKKNLAFTLAEMMVVLALFSIVSAATLPVITARQQMGVGDGAEGSVEDPWEENTTESSIGYVSKNAQSKTAAVMVGGQVTDSAAGLGYPQLIVSDNYGTGTGGSDDASQIIFLKRNGSTPYYAGRIMFENSPSGSGNQSIGTIALGANTHVYKTNTASRIYNTAIGSNAMYAGSVSINSSYNVAIGNNTLRRPSSQSVAVGNYASYGVASSSSVFVGNYAGSDPKFTSTDDYSVVIGDRAGLWTTESSPTSRKLNVLIGTYAGYASVGDGNLLMGYYAGAGQKKTPVRGNYNVGIGSKVLGESTSSNAVAIGAYAGYSGDTAKSASGIYVGYYAGLFSNASSSNAEPVHIGHYAGTYDDRNAIAIGYYAAYGHQRWGAVHNMDSVAIGTFAGYYYDFTQRTSYFPAVTIGNYAGYSAYAGNSAYAVLIGSYAGYGAKDLYASVCIGKDSCRGSYGGSYLLRITSKGGTRTNIGTVKTGQSHIGDVPAAIESNTGGWWVPNAIYDTLLITPLYGNLTYTTDSSIVLFGDVFSKNSTLKIGSDRRLKENIRPAKYGLKDIRKINIYNYTWKNDSAKEPQIGVIAQEMQKVIPEGVHKNKDGYLSVSSTWLVYPMVNAIKELDSQVQTVKNGVIAYAKEYVYLVQKVNKLEKEVKSLEYENRVLSSQVKAAYTKTKKAESSR